VSRSFSVAYGVAQRGIRKLVGNPLGTISQMAVPVFFLIAFTGALSAVGNTKGFGYYDFTAFEFVFVLYQATIFAGVFTAIEAASDYGSGIGDRFMVSVPRRPSIMAGYVAVAIVRGLFAAAVAWGVALVLGMSVRGNALDIVALMGLALLLTAATTLYGLGIAVRFRSAAAGVLVMLPAFAVLFLTPVFAPRDQLSGWLKTAAGANPLTPPIEAGRGFLAADPTRVWASFGVATGMIFVFFLWAIRSMRAAERGPSAAPARRQARGPRARRTGARART
jgi:ABC-2 type transport system permease protein